MVEYMSRKGELFEAISDLVWPRLTGEPPTPPPYTPLFDARHHDLLDEINQELSSRLRQVEERIRVVESKLLGLLTLTSVLSVAVTAILAAAVTVGPTERPVDAVSAWCAVALVFYIAVQLLRSLWTTVDGLMRRSYRQLSPADLTPDEEENTHTYRIRLLNAQVHNMQWNDWVIDQKVSAMAVAHVALRNALTATFPLIIVALIFAVVGLASMR